MVRRQHWTSFAFCEKSFTTMFSTTLRRKWSISWNPTSKNTVKKGLRKRAWRDFRAHSKHNAVQKADFVHSPRLLRRLPEIRLPRAALHQYRARPSFFIYFELLLPPIRLPGQPARFPNLFEPDFKTAKNTTNAQNWKHDMPDEQRARSIDDCVKTEAQECARPYSNLIPFFCGSSR